MSIKTTTENLKEIISGQTTSNFNLKSIITGSHFDAREIKLNNIFFALPGEKTHGHEFLDKAFENNAALAIVEDTNLLTRSLYKDKLICVENSLQAMHQIAAWWRNEITCPIVAITGSVGKTTVKQMLKTILTSCIGPGTASDKSFNNHVGVPFTLLQINKTDSWAIVEIGMNHPGEIFPLSKMTNPNLAIVTEVAAAHIEGLGSMEGIAKEKLSIFDGNLNCIKIINGDNKYIQEELSRRKDTGKIFSFGINTKNDLLISDIKSDGINGINLTINYDKNSYNIKTHITGKHHAANIACASFAAIKVFHQIDLSQIEKTLETYKVPSMRGEITKYDSGKILYNDAYNANPKSMAGFLEFADECIKLKSKVLLVVGDMRELGSIAEEEHKKVGEMINLIKPAKAIIVGSYSEIVKSKIMDPNIKCLSFKDSCSAKDTVQKEWNDTSNLLMIKASRGIELEKIL